MVGIVSNTAALFAQRNLGTANSLSELSIGRLSSGNAIIRAADDVAGLSIGTILGTNVSTLRTALDSANQAGSLLQIADGTLGELTNVLQRQKALAVAANSGTVSDNERAFLDQEFQALASELDRLVETTEFNGIKLLDGSIFDVASQAFDVSSTGTAAQATITTDTSAAGDTITLLGYTFNFSAAPSATQIGSGNAATTADNLAAFFTDISNNSAVSKDARDALSQFTYASNGVDTVTITAKNTGTQYNYLSSVGAVSGQVNTLTFAGGGNEAITQFTGGVDGNLTTGGPLTTKTTSAGTVLSQKITTGSSDVIGDDILTGLGTADGKIVFNNSETYLATDTFSFRTQDGTLIASVDFGTGGVGSTANVQTFRDAINASSALAAFGITADTTVATSGEQRILTVSGPAGIIIEAAADVDDRAAVTSIGEETPGTLARFSYAAAAEGDTVTINGVTFENDGGTDGVTPGTTEVNSTAELIAAINGAFNGTITAELGDANVIYLSGPGLDTPSDLAVSYAGLTDAEAGLVLSVKGTTGGIDVSGIQNNADFVGTIDSFTASYVSANKVSLSVTVGDITYSGVIDDTTPATARAVRLSAEGSVGGYFNIELSSGGLAVADQSDANVLADRINKAFSTVTFAQQKDVDASTYQGYGTVYVGTTQTGSLAGSSVDFTLTSADAPSIRDVSVSAPSAGSTDSVIQITLANGDVYQSPSGLTNDITQNTTVVLTNLSNAQEKIEISFGSGTLTGGDAGDTNNSVVLLETDEQALAFQTALKEAFGIGSGSAGLDFQVGLSATDVINVALEDATTGNIYRNDDGDVVAGLNVATAEDASAASAVLDNAINKVTSIRAVVGSLQSRFDFASNSITSSIQNTEAARSTFLDVDIAEESTNFASYQVRLQASISVLAQANQLPQNLLKLIG